MRLPFAGTWHPEPVEGWFETMVLALTVWLCTLPLVGLFVLPFFGREKLLALDDLAQELRPEMRDMAGQVTTSETKVAVLGFLWRYPTTALTAPDLAYQTGRESGEVQRALADLASLGLVEHRSACDWTFYRLTPNKRRLAQLEELIAWQESWLEQARRLTQLVGPSLRRSTEGRT